MKSKDINKDIKVSVIVPVYNNETTIELTIKSVLNQTHKNFEVIVVDDGSTDSSVSVVEKLRKNNPQIILIQQHHNGVSAARNLGIKNASGKYIMFCDADDRVDTKWIEKCVDKNCDYAICKYVDNNNLKKSFVLSYENCIDQILNNFIYTCRSVCTKCFNKDILEKNNILFDNALFCYEDGLFVFAYMLCLSKSAKVNYVNEKLYFYQNNKHGAHTKLNAQQEDLYYKKMNIYLEKFCKVSEFKNKFAHYINTSFYYFKLTRLIRENKPKEATKLIKQNKNYLNWKNLNSVSRARERFLICLGSGKILCKAYRLFG